jgi:hypothetical protein
VHGDQNAVCNKDSADRLGPNEVAGRSRVASTGFTGLSRCASVHRASEPDRYSKVGSHATAFALDGQGIMLFDFNTRTWSQLVQGWGLVRWSVDSH